MELRHFQKITVEKMLHFLKTNSEHCVYNASEMGCGKTVETISAIKELNPQKVLIICPAIMKETWKREITKWLPDCLPRVFDTHNSCFESHVPVSRIDFSIVSYNLISNEKVKNVILKKNINVLVCDESHALKTSRTKRTRMILGSIWPYIPYRICLSGTPATRSIADLYTVFHKMLPQEFQDFRSFTERYTNPRWNGYGVVYEGLKNGEELSKLMRENFYVRDKLAEVATEIPEKNWCHIALPNSLCISHDETPYEKEEHKEYVKSLKQAILNNRLAPPAPKAIASKRRLQAIKKLPSIIEFAEGLIEQDLPLVIFGWHLDVVNTLAKHFNTIALTGDTSQRARQELIDDFQNKKTNIIVLNMQAGGVGITLTRSCNIILSELDYSPSTISQAVARCARIGQQNVVNIYYFVVENSLETDIWDIVINKIDTFSKVV